MARLTDQELQILAQQIKSNPQLKSEFDSKYSTMQQKPSALNVGTGILSGALQGFQGKIPGVQKQTGTSDLKELIELQKFKTQQELDDLRIKKAQSELDRTEKIKQHKQRLLQPTRVGDVKTEVAQTDTTQMSQETAQPDSQYTQVPTGKYDEFGDPEYKYELTPEAKLKEKVTGEVEAQRGKDILRAEQDKVRAELSQDVMKNVWLDMLDQSNKQTGWKPGIGTGLYATVTGKMKWNDFYEAFEGTSNEYAARIARIAMPQTRAIRAIYLFKAGRPDQFSTIESGTNNLKRSYETIISNDMANNPESYIPGFTGKPEEMAQLKEMLEEFGDRYEEGMYRHVFARNPNLLKQETTDRYGLFDDSEWEVME